jgi:hypothetical protein
MSKVRAKDSGKFVQQTGMQDHPQVDKLDLASSPTKLVVNTFHRGPLGPSTGHARANMANMQIEGPTVNPGAQE